MENETTVTVTNVTPEAVIPAKPTERKSKKGQWGRVGAPPKDIKFPRGAYTIKDLLVLQGTNPETGKPNICELTLRNYVTAHVCGYRIVKKKVNGKVVETRISVPVTIVQLPRNAEKDTVGRPNFRFMSKAAYDANQKNLAAAALRNGKKTPAGVTTPIVTTETVVA